MKTERVSVLRAKIEKVFDLPQKEALDLEWLETNGRGGYASSTILNCHTRRYHGLLVANLKDPPGRHVLLSKFEDSLRIKGNEFFLSCHQYPGAFFPQNGDIIKEFRLASYPEFTYQLSEICIHKSIMLVYGEDRVLIRYDCGNCPGGVLRLKPFLAYRGYHTLSRQNLFLHVKTYGVKNGFKIQLYDGMPPLYVQTSVKSQFFPSPVWYNNFVYSFERERGYDWLEDLFQPGVLEIPIKRGSVVIVSASLNIPQRQLKRIWTAEETRRARETSINEMIVNRFGQEDRPYLRDLIIAGQQFMIKTPTMRPAIIAGYHWFGEWGRDTLISLPGLTFCCGRTEEGIAILTSLGEFERDGLLPNYLSADEKENAYNSVDASLWYFWAVQQMLKYTDDIETIRSGMWPVMKRILRHFMAGTVFNIYMSDNGLLHAGGGDTCCLTWMDTVVGGKPVVVRGGYPVEINALWYNATCFAGELAERFGEDEFPFSDLIPKIQQSFHDTFWIESEGYLGDVFSNGSLDRAVRPNQILAVSLPYSPLTPSHQVQVVNKVKDHLLTPCGLRTLSPEDGQYMGRYGGDTLSRDMAYHQGTVWPWLLAHFGDAYLKVAGDKAAAKAFLLNYLRLFLSQHLAEAGIGCIPEIFDGDPPHRPNGCISQAWSTAELIRLYSLLTETS
ncbi:MAG: amylo-alpha-1,6-glucosidase [Syntrophales bacterium]|nr:amylo-alpha-1,6-glucosidase [Syntrophales bacterium]